MNLRLLLFHHDAFEFRCHQGKIVSVLESVAAARFLDRLRSEVLVAFRTQKTNFMLSELSVDR